MSRSIARTVQVLGIASIATILIATSRAQDVGAGAAFTTGSGAASFQVLTSGPLHESFARPVVFGGGDAYYVSATPPQLFEEVPPFQRPAGFSEWVPGYWSFDDQPQTWIWVSGTWRIPPPGYTWVSGYWINSTRGWRYVGGYWASAASVNAEIDYVPAPPDPIDVNPIGTAPFADAIWVSGNWMWAGASYSWRNGYWVQARSDWVWTPASYIWTPSGYVFQDALWDHALDRRGLLFAPVAFRPGTSLTAGFSFSPGYVINVGLFSDSLFVRPVSDQYYFGDYYATTWWDAGFYPAFSFHMSRFGYDPLFAHASWQRGRNDPRWLAERRTRFLNLQTHSEARPPRTLDEQARRPVAAPGTIEGETAPVAIAASDVAAAKITPLTIETAPESGRPDLVARVKERDQARAARIKLETPAGPAAELTQPRRVKVSKDLLPGAAEAAKVTTSMPDRPRIPKVETARQPEALKDGVRRLAEPSIDRPVDHMGRAGGKAEPTKPDGAKPEPPKRSEGVPPVAKPEVGKPEPQPKPPKRSEGIPPDAKPDGAKPQPAPGRKPDAGKPKPKPPTPDAGKSPPAPKPDGGKPTPPPQPDDKPDQKPPAPHGNPKPNSDSRPEGPQ